MSARKFISVILVSVAFCLVFNVAKAATAEEILKEIARLQALIVQLQKQLAELQGKPAAWCHDFNVNLRIGDSGLEVEALQTALEKEGFDVSKDPKGYFGEYTASAVVGFQEKYKDEILIPWGLTHGTGFVGRTTRAKLNKLYGCGIVFPPPIGPSITVISPNGGEKWVKGEKHLVKLSNPPVECKEGSSNCEVYSIELIDENSRVVGMISCGASTPKEAASMEPKEIEWDTHSVLACCGAGCLPIEVQPGKYKVRIASRYFSWKLIDESDNYFSIVSPPTTCTDSDGGRNYYTKGTVIDSDTGKSFADYCLSDSTLREYFCLSPSLVFPGGSVAQEDYTCPYGCKDGACQQKVEGLVDGYNHYCFTLSDIKIGTTINFDYTSIDDPYLRYFMIGIDCPEAQGKRWYTSSGCSSAGCSTGKYCNIGVGYSGRYSYTFGSALPGSHQICTWPTSDHEPGQTYVYKWKVEKSIAQPTITVIYPNGGERWTIGETRRISWNSVGVNYVRIYIIDPSIIGSGSTNYIYDGFIPASTGYYDWLIQRSQLPGYNLEFPRNYKIRIDGFNEAYIGAPVITQDLSDNYFTIVSP
jgi:hypothetical protein